ncbi:MAG: L,D-transpeptidase [Anaerolineales bacterium]
MIRVLWSTVIVLVVGILLASPIQAAGAQSHLTDGLCLPGSDLSLMGDCAILGPRAYLQRMAEMGITFPPRPLLAHQPDPEMSNLPYLYARITRERAPLFDSLDAAVMGEPVYRNLETGFNYVTYIDAAEVDGKRYYMIAPGVWMQGFGFSRVATPNFQGLEFSETPSNDFGWVLFTNESKFTPGYQVQDFTGREYYRYDIVQIYAVETVGDQNWYRIGPEEWLESRQVARVAPKPVPPQGVESGRWIEVNLKEQTLAAYEERTLVFATVIASGRPGSWTRPGLFQIYQKKPTELMTGAFTADRSDSYYLEDVPWTMYFDQARALHGTYWHNSYGVPQSRGCVNLSPGDSKWLFDWAQEGDWVYVWDPSGETPVEDDLYGPGGA